MVSGCRAYKAYGFKSCRVWVRFVVVGCVGFVGIRALHVLPASLQHFAAASWQVLLPMPCHAL